MLNIYNKPLVACGDSSMSSGSWDSEGKCSEFQMEVCIKFVLKILVKAHLNFQIENRQSDWSNQIEMLIIIAFA